MLARLISSRSAIARPITNMRQTSNYKSQTQMHEKQENNLEGELQEGLEYSDASLLDDNHQGAYNDRKGSVYGDRPYPPVQNQRRMNKGINRVELLGGIAGDPIFKNTQRGSEFASFNLYTNVDRKLNNGEIQTSVEVHNVIGFGGIAKYIKNNLYRGSRVYMVGRLHYSGGQLMADGTRTPRMASINVENIYLLGRTTQSQQQRTQPNLGQGTEV